MFRSKLESVFLFAQISIVIYEGSALTCYKCSNTQITNDNNLDHFMRNVVQRPGKNCLKPQINQTAKECIETEAGWFDPKTGIDLCMETCPEKGDWRCGAVLGKISAKSNKNYTDYGSYEADYEVRGCINITNLPKKDFMCAMSGKPLDIITDQLRVETGLFKVMLHINWACYCNGNFCKPEHCDPTDVQIGDSCINGPLFGSCMACIGIMMIVGIVCWCRGECGDCCYPCRCCDSCSGRLTQEEFDRIMAKVRASQYGQSSIPSSAQANGNFEPEDPASFSIQSGDIALRSPEEKQTLISA